MNTDRVELGPWEEGDCRAVRKIGRAPDLGKVRPETLDAAIDRAMGGDQSQRGM